MAPMNGNNEPEQTPRENDRNAPTGDRQPEVSGNQPQHQHQADVEVRDKRPQDYKIEKFHEQSILKADGSNYITWKRRIILALRNRKWEDYATGSIPCPGRADDPLGYSAWRHIDSLVMSQLASNMEDSLYGEISTDEMTAVALWEAVKNRFEESSELAQTTLHVKLCGKRIQETETMKDHILHLRKLKAEYTNRGGKLTRAQWHSIIVTSLEQHSYWHQMDLYADVIDDPEDLIRKLELKELRGGGERIANANAALLAQQQQMQPRNPVRPLGRGGRPVGIYCGNCRRNGHSFQNCYAPGGGAAHRRPQWYRVPPGLLEKERAQLSAHIRAIDDQRAQMASNYDQPQPTILTPPSNASSSNVPPVRHEILMVVDTLPARDPTVWILDSGATSHMTFHREHFVDYREITPVAIYTARENNMLYAVGCGTVRIVFKVHGREVPALVSNILYVPEICANLLSLAKLDERGLEYRGKHGQLEFWNEGRHIASATKLDGQWIMTTESFLQSTHLATTRNNITKSLQGWHQRLAHVNQQRILQLRRDESVHGLELSDMVMPDCEACVLSKMTATTAQTRSMRAIQAGDIIHSDIEYMGHKSFSQAEYSLKFVDEFSNYIWVYALGDKQATTVLAIWSKLRAFFMTQFSVPIKALHSDNSSEYVNSIMDNYNSENGIEHHKIAPRRHEMNGRAERLNRTGSDAVRSMLLSAGLHEAYWAEAYETYAYVHNRTATSAVPRATPYEVLFKRKPNLGHIRVFGCTAYMRIPPEERMKLAPKAIKLVLIGYRDDAAYRLFDPAIRKMYYSRDVIFDEFHTFRDESSLPQAQIEDIPDDDPKSTSIGQQTVDSQQTVRRSHRIPKPTIRKIIGTEQESSLQHLDHPQRSNVVRERRYVAGIPIPRDVHEAFRCDQANEWIAAMQYEISKLEGMNVWDITERSLDVHTVQGLWVFNLKEDVDGSLEYRARWVARGDSQIPGIEFEDTFASAGDYVIARIVFAHAAVNGNQLVTLDINSAYLHSPLDQQNLFVEYPAGFEVPGFQDPCCRLRKALYGLKQGARAWESHLSQQLASIGFKKCISAPCAYYRSTNEGEDIVSTHVDDLQNCTNSLVGDGAIRFKTDIKKFFDFKEKDTKRKAIVLGMTVFNDEENGRMKISAGERIDGMLNRYAMVDAKTADSPMLMNALAFFDQDDSEGFDPAPWPYARLLGELLWIGSNVRPDIAYAVNVLARHLKRPKKCHWEAAKRILRYLKGTRNLGIVYATSREATIFGYCDSDWATDPSNRKSTTGYVFTYAGGAISWKSRKQTVVATSTAEAEYLAASAATNEAKWLRNFFAEINKIQSQPTTIFVDNMAAIAMTRNPVYQSKMKHIDLRAHHLRDEVVKQSVHLEHISGDVNPADILTKPLSSLSHKKCVMLLGME